MVHVSIKVRDDIKRRRGTVVGFQGFQLFYAPAGYIFTTQVIKNVRKLLRGGGERVW